MDKVFLYFFNKKTLLFILFLGCIAFIISMWQRYAYIDDCFFGEQAYWLAKDGIVRTKTIHAGLGWEERLFVYHKLNIWIGALIIKTLGWSVYYFKTFTLLVYLSFFFLLKKYLQIDRSRFPGLTYLMVCLLIFINPLTFIYGFTFRPEILVMATGFVSFMALEKVRTNDSRSFFWIIIAGVAAGLAFLTHLNGLIFAVSGFFYLIIYRKYRFLIPYLLSGGIIMFFYFIDLLPSGNMARFLAQINNWPDDVSGNFHSKANFLISVFVKLSTEHQRFFWSDKVFAFSILFFLSVLMAFKYLKETHRPLLIYTTMLILLLNLLGSQIAERYLLYYFPMMALLIALSVLYFLKQRQFIRLTVISFVLLVQLGLTAKHWVSIMSENSDFVTVNNELRNAIPAESEIILAPYTFIYNEISDKILTYHTLEYFEVRQKKQFTGAEASAYCVNLGIDHIIIDYFPSVDKKVERWFEPALNGNDLNYRIFRKYKGHIILSRIRKD
jgi:hypothetical protein